MDADPVWLGLEVKYLDRAVAFYRDALRFAVDRRGEAEAHVDGGDVALVLRTPDGGVPRGGVHTHYALAVPPSVYDDRLGALREDHEVVEHAFGGATSLYVDDPDDHSVELGDVGDEDGPPVQGLFEVVLEVEDLEEASRFYEALGAERNYGSGEPRRRRLDWGGLDLELWEPRLGIADGRGGVHVDLGVAVNDPSAAVDAVDEDVLARHEVPADALPVDDALDDGATAHRIRDPEGHYATFLPR